MEDGIGTGALPPLPKGRGTKPCLVVGYKKRSNTVFSSILSLYIYPPTANAVPPPLGKEGNALAQFHLPDKLQFNNSKHFSVYYSHFLIARYSLGEYISYSLKIWLKCA